MKLTTEEIDGFKSQKHFIYGKPYLIVQSFGWALVGFYVDRPHPLFVRFTHCSHFRNAGDYGTLTQTGASEGCDWRYEGTCLFNLNATLRFDDYGGALPVKAEHGGAISEFSAKADLDYLDKVRESKWLAAGDPYLLVQGFGWGLVGHYIDNFDPLYARFAHVNHFRNAHKNYGRLCQEGADDNCEWRYEGSSLINVNSIIRINNYNGVIPRTKIETTVSS